MTSERDIERILDHWFAERPTQVADRVLDAVSDRIGRQSQRPSWRLKWRHLGMNMTFKLATGIAAVAIVAILGYNLLPRASSGVGGAPSIDGTWVTTFTKADLIASPLRVDDDEINDGNWGDFTLTFEDGRFSLALSNSVQSGTTPGTYTTDGDAIVMVFQTSPTVTETFGFRWSIANDVLTFQRDETVGAGPTPFLVKPWTRSS